MFAALVLALSTTLRGYRLVTPDTILCWHRDHERIRRRPVLAGLINDVAVAEAAP